MTDVVKMKDASSYLVKPGPIYREDGTILCVSRGYIRDGALFSRRAPPPLHWPSGERIPYGCPDPELVDFWNGLLPFHQ